MPIYDYKCVNCGIIKDVFAKMDDHHLQCEKCGDEWMERLMPGTHGINMGVGAYGYYDDNLQKYIGTNKERRSEMQRQGVTEKIGKGWY